MRADASRDPLRPAVYLRRRWQRVLPTALVVGLATALIVCVLTPTNTFRQTADADVRPLQTITMVAPARRPGLDDSLRTWIARAPGFERTVPVRLLWVRHPMIVGDAYCALLLISDDDIPPLVQRVGLRLVAGRLPDRAHPGVAMQEEVARARGLGLGKRFGSLTDPDDSTPGSYEIVGLLRGPSRIAFGVTSGGLFDQFLLARAPAFLLVLSRAADKPASDAYLHSLRDGDGPALQVTDSAALRKRTDEALKNLPLLIGFVSLACGLVVALVVALLQLVTFQARADEHAILLALGHRPGRLVSRAAGECAILAFGGWLAGLALAEVVLYLYESTALAPRGLLMRPFDPQPAWASVLLPVVSIVVTVLVLARRLHQMDPVDVVQRRGS